MMEDLRQRYLELVQRGLALRDAMGDAAHGGSFSLGVECRSGENLIVSRVDKYVARCNNGDIEGDGPPRERQK